MKEFGVYDDSELKGGATDVGNVSQVIPTIQPMLSVTEEPLLLYIHRSSERHNASIGNGTNDDRNKRF